MRFAERSSRRLRASVQHSGRLSFPARPWPPTPLPVSPLLDGLPESPAALRLSAVIIARNEESCLADCLRSIQDLVEEIVLVDDLSTDRTREIARSFGARILSRPFDSAACQMNFGIAAARGEWILVIDADERVTPELAAEIMSVLNHRPVCAAYAFPRRNIVFGRFLRHGGNYPDFNSPRLLRRGRAWFEDQPVHAGLLVRGASGHLRHPLLHLTAPTLQHYLEKFNAYTSREAERMDAGGVRYSAFRMLAHSFGHLAGRLFLQRAFLDGAAGLQYLLLGFFYDLTRYLKLRERQRARLSRNSSAREETDPPATRYAYWH